ncbi:hypothetical protein QYM36_011121 [Artemia franciscana]|uniref:EF-hand domain-containing protein n=1 Tax=Artemia franciscana TaxID=6661 RepID=A0AA88HL75_ARTSF|nr:hypothetical protein QYM36_011121 [Artemia franciscana]
MFLVDPQQFYEFNQHTIFYHDSPKVFTSYRAESSHEIQKHVNYTDVVAFALYKINEYASQYAHFVFKTIRRSKSGEINFEEFLCCLSNISRGTLEEKIRWVFNLYDLNNDGLISRTEMLAIISSVYEMIGPSIEPPAGEETISDHVDRIFDSVAQKRELAALQEEKEAENQSSLSRWIEKQKPSPCEPIQLAKVQMCIFFFFRVSVSCTTHSFGE